MSGTPDNQPPQPNMTGAYERHEAICTEAAMSQWERSLKRPDLSEKDRVRGAVEAYKRQAFAFNMLPTAPVEHVTVFATVEDMLKHFGQEDFREGSRADYVTASEWEDYIEVPKHVLERMLVAYHAPASNLEGSAE